MEIIVLIVVVVGVWVGLRAMATSRRRKWLLAKYADLAIVEAIMRRKFGRASRASSWWMPEAARSTSMKK